MEADGEGDYFNEIADEELRRGSRHLGVDEDMFPDFRKHREVPLQLPAGVHDENHRDVQSVQAEDEAAKHWGGGVQQGVEPLLPGPPVRQQARETSGHNWLLFRNKIPHQFGKIYPLSVIEIPKNLSFSEEYIALPPRCL